MSEVPTIDVLATAAKIWDEVASADVSPEARGMVLTTAAVTLAAIAVMGASNYFNRKISLSAFGISIDVQKDS